MKYIYHDAADAEYAEHIRHFLDLSPELGSGFVDEIESGIARILEHPLAYREHLPGIRRLNIHRFPFGIVYKVHSDFVQIVAIMHLADDPDYWKDRV